ncbi:MAG: hypothetical protein AAFU71_16560 [Cyanobacteria bacterium J06632_22]
MPPSVSPSNVPYAYAPDLSADDYLVLGVSTCFVKADGEVYTVKVLEPIPSAYLEVLFKAVPTSYHGVHATHLGAVLTAEGAMLPDIDLVQEHDTVRLCDDFVSRAEAAARTYKMRSQLQQRLPLGTTYVSLNFSTEKKRLLNEATIVNDDDNIKQHAYTHKTL